MLKVCKGFHRINLASDRWGCHMFVQCGVHRERELKMKQSGAGSVSAAGGIGEGQCRCSWTYWSWWWWWGLSRWGWAKWVPSQTLQGTTTDTKCITNASTMWFNFAFQQLCIKICQSWSLVSSQIHMFWTLLWCFWWTGPHPKKQAKGSKRKTRQAKALERVASIKKAPRSFLDLLQEVNHFCFFVDCDALSLCLSICLSLIIFIVIDSVLVHEMCIGDRYQRHGFWLPGGSQCQICFCTWQS